MVNLSRQEDRYTYLFEHKVLDMILEQNLTRPGQTVLSAVSGGADSVCLLLVLKKLSEALHFQLRAVHVEHGIRGQESLDDAAYVEKLCEELQVPLTVEHIRVIGAAKENGRTIEEEARIQRYRIFRETAVKTGAERVAVAHSKSDQAETVLWNLVRGSSVRGLAGIRPERPLGPDISVIRPLLGVTRQEIERYLSARGISFRTDRTNMDREITRNRIRLDIIPGLKQLNGRAEEHIAETAEEIAGLEDYLGRMTSKASDICISLSDKGMPVLLLEPFLREDPVIRKRVLRECIRLCMDHGSLKDIGRVHVKDLMKLVRMDNGKSVDLPGGIRAVREDGILCFAKVRGPGRPEPAEKVSVPEKSPDRYGISGKEDDGRDESGFVLEVPFEGEKTVRAFGASFLMSCRQNGEGPVMAPEKRFTKWIAYATINPNQKHTLMFRHRRPGDFLTVRADGSRKKLSDYLIDRKVPREKRDSVIVLAEGSRVLWVIGGRISEDAKVQPGSGYLAVEVEDERDC